MVKPAELRKVSVFYHYWWLILIALVNYCITTCAQTGKLLLAELSHSYIWSVVAGQLLLLVITVPKSLTSVTKQEVTARKSCHPWRIAQFCSEGQDYCNPSHFLGFKCSLPDLQEGKSVTTQNWKAQKSGEIHHYFHKEIMFLLLVCSCTKLCQNNQIDFDEILREDHKWCKDQCRNDLWDLNHLFTIFS